MAKGLASRSVLKQARVKAVSGASHAGELLGVGTKGYFAAVLQGGKPAVESQAALRFLSPAGSRLPGADWRWPDIGLGDAPRQFLHIFLIARMELARAQLLLGVSVSGADHNVRGGQVALGGHDLAYLLAQLLRYG